MALRAIAALACGALLAQAAGCGPPCQPSEIEWTRGTTESNGALVRYESTPQTGPFAPFNGEAVVRFRHRMGVRPTEVAVYLSFNENPPQRRGAGSAQAAGNQALIVEQNDEYVAIHNNSCANYYVRIVATALAPQDASIGDAADSGDATQDAADDAIGDASDDG